MRRILEKTLDNFQIAQDKEKGDKHNLNHLFKLESGVCCDLVLKSLYKYQYLHVPAHTYGYG